MAIAAPEALQVRLRRLVAAGDTPGAQALLTDWILRELPKFLCRSTAVLCWRAWPWINVDPIYQGGSAFLIRTPVRILGVTAGHVVDGYLDCKRASSEIEAILGGLHFDLEERLISRGRRVDIATFHVNESELGTIGSPPLEEAWPPTAPAHLGNVVVAGWPGHERVVKENVVTGGMWTGWGQAGLSAHQITVVLDHSQGMLSPIPGIPVPPQHFEVGGISGGPMMTVRQEAVGASVKWWLGGVLHEGRPEYDQVMAERADIIQDDGRIAG